MQSDYLRNKKIGTILRWREEELKRTQEETRTHVSLSSNELTVFRKYKNTNNSQIKNSLDTKNQLIGPGMQRVFDCEMAVCSNVDCDLGRNPGNNLPFRGYKQYLSKNEYTLKSKNNIAGYPKMYKTCILTKNKYKNVMNKYKPPVDYSDEFKECFIFVDRHEPLLEYIV